MYGMKRSPNSDGVFQEVEDAKSDGRLVTKHDKGIAAYCVHNGTPGGQASVHLVAVLEDGRVVDLETSLKLLGDAVDRFREATGG